MRYKIGFIGLGKLGLPVSQILSTKHDVDGHDILMDTDISEVASDKDIVFIAVPTPHEEGYDGRYICSDLVPKDFDYSAVIDVLEKINDVINDDTIVVLISTVLPGTIRKILLSKISRGMFVYNPYLIAMGSVKEDFLNPEMIMMAGEKSAVDRLERLYKDMCTCDRYIKGTYEEIESLKIFYNTFISFKITFANMILDVSEKLGNMNVDVVTEALAGSTDRIMSEKYMKAGMGDGGSCHPRDNIALRWLSKELELGYDMFGAIIEAREKQAFNMAKSILSYGKKIMFSSNAFKPNVDIEDGSYSVLVQQFVVKLGGRIVNESPDVYVMVHPGDKPLEGAVNFDPWRTNHSDIKYGLDYEVIIK